MKLEQIITDYCKDQSIIIASQQVIELADRIKQQEQDHNPYSPIPEVAECQKADWCGSHLGHTREEWQCQVGGGDTQLSYWEWVEHQIEEDSSATIDPSDLQPVVTAKTHDDNWKFDITFNCTAWFAQAADDEITGLIGIGFGGDSESDDVALYFDGRNQAVTEMFRHKAGGFECYVNSQEALAWIAKHRNHLTPHCE